MEISQRWVDYFFRIVDVVKVNSRDVETKVGCVIVDQDKRIISTGYNSFPAGCNDDLLPSTRPEKYDFMVHAEVNAVMYARTSLKGCSVFQNISPCINCTKMLITAGVANVFFKTKYSDFDSTLKVWDACGYLIIIHEDCYLMKKGD